MIKAFKDSRGTEFKYCPLCFAMSKVEVEHKLISVEVFGHRRMLNCSRIEARDGNKVIVNLLETRYEGTL